MKKNLLLFLILIFTFLSCSSNDSDNTEDDTTILPKAIISIYPGFSSDTALFSYDKNKIKSISYKKDKIYYHYEDNVIVGKTYYNLVQGKEVKINEETYSYTNGRLASIKYLDNWASSPRKINIRSVYTYLSDTLVKEQRFSTDYITKIEAEDDYFSLLKIKNGNLIKRDYVKTKTGITSYTYTYVYDNMNSPFKNITGMSSLINEEESSFNNRLSSFSVDSSDYLDIKDYKYDMKGYPILETYYKGGKQVTTITKYLY